MPGLEKIMRSFIARGLIRLAVGKRRYKRMQLTLERWNAKPGGLPVSQASYAKLAKHYASDVEALSDLCGERPRWFAHAGEGTALL